MGLGKRPTRRVLPTVAARRLAADAEGRAWFEEFGARLLAALPGAGLALFGSRARGVVDRWADFDCALGLGDTGADARRLARWLQRLRDRPDLLLAANLGPGQLAAAFVRPRGGGLWRLDLHCLSAREWRRAVRALPAAERVVLARPAPGDAGVAPRLPELGAGAERAALLALAAAARLARRDALEADALLGRARAELADALRSQPAGRGGASGVGLSAAARRRLAGLRPQGLRAGPQGRAVAATLRACQQLAGDGDRSDLADRFRRLAVATA